MTEDYIDFSNQTVAIGISQGINSAALVCYLAKYLEAKKPKQLLLYMAHFVDHSPKSLEFGTAVICYAIKHFQNVKIKATWNDVLEFFRKSKMIPHPSSSPCSRLLKFEPMQQWAFEEHDADVDLVGYVREELKRRTAKQKKHTTLAKLYPIGHLSNEECFQIVDQEIGWHPPIYDYICGVHGFCKKCKKWMKRDKPHRIGKPGCRARIFNHNNCRPCKNDEEEDYENNLQFYVERTMLAADLSKELGVYWGRNKAVNMCNACSFD